ncbi:MAG: MFS transporter [Candidatus Heimdallarchaeota archaeon]
MSIQGTTPDKEILVAPQESHPLPRHRKLTKRQRRANIIILAITSFFASSANSIYYIFYNPYFLEIYDSVKLIGIVATIASIVPIFGLIVSSYLSELIGYKRVFILSQILIAVSFVFFCFSPKIIIWVIIAVLSLNFVFSSNEVPNTITFTETAGEKQKGKITSVIAIFGRVGEVIVSAAIPALGVMLVFTNKERSYFFIYSSAIFIVISLLLLFFITDPSSVIESKQKEKREREFYNIKEGEKEKSKQEKNKNGNTKLSIAENCEGANVVESGRVSKEQQQFIRSFIETFKDRWVLRVVAIFLFDAIV